MGRDMNLACFTEGGKSRLMATRGWKLLSPWGRRRWRMRGKLGEWNLSITNCILPELKLSIYINILFWDDNGRTRSRGSEHRWG